MLPDGNYVDGSWLLTVHIQELSVEKQVRVQGDWSVAELLAELTKDLPTPIVRPPALNEFSLRSGTPKTGWMDHGFWWPAKYRWLLQATASLNQYGLQADAILQLVPIYGRLIVQLPDLQTREFVGVSFAEPVFRITRSICRQLNIRYPEELSLAQPLTSRDFKQTRFAPGLLVDRIYQTAKRSTFQRSATIGGRPPLPGRTVDPACPNGNNGSMKLLINGDMCRASSHASTASEHMFGPPKIRDKRYRSNPLAQVNRYSSYTPSAWSKYTYSPASINTMNFEFRSLEDPTLSCSPLRSIEEALLLQLITHPNGFTERLRFSTIWLDSSKSLMEQGFSMLPSKSAPTNAHIPNELGTLPAGKDKRHVEEVKNEKSLLLLRFKYINFYDLDSKYDRVRINQLYEQAKWSVIAEQFDVTDDEATLFAALQAQVEIQTVKEYSQQADETDTDAQSLGRQMAAISGLASPANLVSGSGNSRDVSPIGGYLQHFRRMGQSLQKQRPLSAVELGSEIDALLDELATHNLESTELDTYTEGRRSRPRRRTRRPVSPIGVRGTPSPPPERAPPMLHDYVKICRPKRFRLPVFRRFYLATDQLRLLVYKREDDFRGRRNPDEVIFLPGCDVQPQLCSNTEHFNIRLHVPISRVNLPLAAAFSAGVDDDLDYNELCEEVGFKGRLRRRASLLSLTSLSHFSNAFGLQTNHALNGLPKEGLGTGKLCGPSAIALGLVCEVIIRLPDANTYADWLAFLRLAAAVPNVSTSRDDCDDSTISHPVARSLTPTNAAEKEAPVAPVMTTAAMRGPPPPASLSNAMPIAISPFFTHSMFVAERKAIVGLITLTSLRQAGDQVDAKSLSNPAPCSPGPPLTDLHKWMEKRLVDWLPIRMALPKSASRTLETRRVGDQTDAAAPNERVDNAAANTLGDGKRMPAHSTLTGSGIQNRSQVVRRLVNVYSKLQAITSTQAKLKYISLWEQLPHNGVAYFPSRVEISLPIATLLSSDEVTDCQSNRYSIPSWITRPFGGGMVTLSSSRRVEAVGISPSRVLRCDLQTGEVVASWRHSSIQSWHVNWELGELVLQLGTPATQHLHKLSEGTLRTERRMDPASPTRAPVTNRNAGRVVIRPVGVSVRLVAEFLGGYTFLNLRDPEKNQCRNEEVFYKLTAGSAPPVPHN